jgi:hypothetical protein
MFLTADQLLAHIVGDYVLQSDWMAGEKTKKSIAALAHVVTYTVPFLFLTQSPAALAVILVSHFVIDRWRLARYVCWIKNFLQPKFPWTRTCSCGPEEKCGPSCGQPVTSLVRNFPWSECIGTGYHKDRPPWMAVWLMIICDNAMHVICNASALRYL